VSLLEFRRGSLLTVHPFAVYSYKHTWFSQIEKYLLTSFQVKKKKFFRNFMTITLFGAVGTMISFFTISLGKLFPKPACNSLLSFTTCNKGGLVIRLAFYIVLCCTTSTFWACLTVWYLIIMSGAISIFSRMNIGTLDVGDFLGKPSLPFPHDALPGYNGVTMWASSLSALS